MATTGNLTIFTNNFITTLLGISPHEIGKLEAQPTEPVSLTFHSVLKKPYTVPSYLVDSLAIKKRNN
jgi:hypothetical protein